MYKMNRLMLSPMETDGGVSNDNPVLDKDPDFGNDAIADSIFNGDAFKVTSDKLKATPTEEEQPSSVEQKQREESDKLNKIAADNVEREKVEQETLKQIEEKKKAAAPHESETKVKPEVKAIDKNQQQSSTVKQPRDYSGLDPKHVEFLKKQPNSVYDTLVPVLKENAKLKQEIESNKDPNRIPENYYENEQAITLTPEYNRLNDLYTRLDTEGGFYQKQIIRVQQGLPYQELGWSKDRGYYIKTDNIATPEDPEAKAAILGELEEKKAYCISEKVNVKAKAEAYVSDFKQKAANVKEHYKPLIEKHINSLPEELKPKKEHVAEFEKIIHPAHRNNSLVEVAANLYSLALNQGTIINAFLAEKNKEQQIKDDRKAAGPSNKVSLSSSERKPMDSNGRVASKPSGVIDFNKVVEDMEGH